MVTAESVLQLARRHIAEGKRRVAEQEARIAELVRNGRDTTTAQAVLKSFKETLSIMQEHLDFEESRALPGQ
jgi:hypothetical protein